MDFYVLGIGGILSALNALIIRNVLNIRNVLSFRITRIIRNSLTLNL